jgi:hypothetical protein
LLSGAASATTEPVSAVPMTEVGRVLEIWRYPVKSMAGESLLAVEVGWHGLAGDRRWAFVQPDQERSGFPWLTIRDRPDMWHYRPSLTEPGRPEASATTVVTPDGRELDVTDIDLAHGLGRGVRVMKQSRGSFDVAPLSLVTTRTVSSLEDLAGMALDRRRFRANLVVDAGRGAGFPEDGWVGRELEIGTLRMRVDQRDVRCLVVNVDPDSTDRDREVLRAIAVHRDNRAGVYGATTRPGTVRVGDHVRLVD